MKSPVYSAKVKALTAALTRTRRLIARYLRLVGRTGSWPFAWDFNQLHDLEDRLEQRLRQTWGAYYDWHFTAYGWVAA